MLPTTLASSSATRKIKHQNTSKHLKIKQKLVFEEATQPRSVHQDFYFKPRRQQVDWRLISSINVDDIVENTNIQTLQNLIENITFCNVGADKSFASVTTSPDPNMVKLFQISQLIIEFLVHSQNFLLRDQKQQERLVAALEEEVEKNTIDVEKLRQQLDEKTKEVKVLKKTLFAYEIVSKQHADAGAAVPNGVYRCSLCPKAFSSQKFLDSHQFRRHEGDAEELEAIKVKKEQTTTELQKVVQMMEKFTSNLGNPADSKKQEESSKNLEALLTKQLEQEKLKFESELQNLKTAMHRELEQERSLLKQDREAFERMVNDSRKKSAASITKVGDLEDDENSVALSKPKKPSSKPPSTRPSGRRSTDDLQQKIHEEYEKEMKNIQNVITDQVGRLKQHMAVESEQHTQALENKLSMAANEIERLKSIRMDSVDITDLRSPGSYYPRDRKDIWKNYSAVLSDFKNVHDPQLPIVTSKYQHPVDEVRSEKEMINLEVDRFLAEQGLSDVNVKKMVSDPALKSVAAGLSNYISAQRAVTTSEVLCYEEMRALIESQVEKAAASAFNNIGSATAGGVPPLPRRSSMRKSYSGTLLAPSPTKSVKIDEIPRERIIEPSSPSKRGLRALNLQIPPDGFTAGGAALVASPNNGSERPASPTKTPVEVALKTAETIKNAFSSLTARTLGLPKKKSEAEAKLDQAMGFRRFQMDPPAFSTQQSSSNSQQAKYIDISKDGAAPVDPNPTAAAANLSEISTTSGKETATTTADEETGNEEDTSDIDITELSSLQHKAAFAPLKETKPAHSSVKIIKAGEKEKAESDPGSSDVSFDVSEVSDTDSAKNGMGTLKPGASFSSAAAKPLSIKQKTVQVQEEEEDSDFGDEVMNLGKSVNRPAVVESTVIQVGAPASVPLKKPAFAKPAKPVSGHQPSVKSTVSNDDDVLEFLDEIDASLGDHVQHANAKKGNIPDIDDIDDFDSM